MKYFHQIKPIGCLKANAAAIVKELAERWEPPVITQKGEAKPVVPDVEPYEETQETLALLKILALRNRRIAERKTIPATDVIKRIRETRSAP